MAHELKVGDKAPEFQTKDQSGRDVKLQDFIGKKNVVLYFYPKDDTPGCTKEACNFRDQFHLFTPLDAEILGVSVDGVESHLKFAKKYELPFTLLSDSSKTISTSYGTLNERGSSSRMTFVIDKHGIIRAIYPKVKVDEHWEEVKKDLESLNATV